MEEQSQKHQQYLDAMLPSIVTIKPTKNKAKPARRMLQV